MTQSLQPRARNWMSVVSAALMLAAVLVTYRSPDTFSGEWRIAGADYYLLHERRIDFAIGQLRAHGTLPAWYPREALGTPFWSNVQSFPFIPTRLAALSFGAGGAFTVGVWVSAALSAGFAFAWMRRVGIGPVGSAAGGWTFASAGFFASRVTAGHLPLLEAYPALPALLWAVECVRQSPPGRSLGWRVVVLAVLVGSFALAGHPQLPMYALGASVLYLVARFRGWRLAMTGASVALGVGLAAFAIVPMTKLVARSTRVLDLDAAPNDIALPYWRLKSLLRPFADGVPDPMKIEGAPVFAHPSQYFWDTVIYVGWAPLLAVVVGGVGLVMRRRPGDGPIAVALLVGLAGLAASLPWTRELMGAGGPTLLRSPSRLTYLFTFAAAGMLGFAIHRLLSWRVATSWGRRAIAGVVAVVVAGQGWDLYRHARPFLVAWNDPVALDPLLERALRDDVSDGRAAIDGNLRLTVNRRIDDVGFFDSILLSNVYSGLIDFSRLPARTNVQELDGGRIPTRGLRAGAVRMMITREPRTLEPIADWEATRVYRIPDPAERVSWFAASVAEYADESAVSEMRRDASVDLARRLILPPSARPSGERVDASSVPVKARLTHARPTPDRIEVAIDAPAAGFVRVIEAYDVGWQARVNGEAVEIHPAHGMVMAIATPAGRSRIVLEYFTPGRNAGLAISGASLVMLGMLAWGVARSGRFGYPAVDEEPSHERSDLVA